MASTKYYFVGGPREDHIEEFFKLLKEKGGPPENWTVYPHANGDGKALHIIDGATREEVLEHLSSFMDIYEMSELIEVINRNL